MNPLTDDSPPAIRIRGLKKIYRGGHEALQGLDMTVLQGDVYGFIGPNGAGKTTTISALVGLVRWSMGFVEVFGYQIPEQLPRVQQRIGVALDNHPFIPGLSAHRNLRLLADLRSKSVPDEWIQHVLSLVDLTNRAPDKVGSYSRGMRQRLGVAAALLHNPDLVILDEPFSGLDPEGVRDLRRTVLRLHEEGRTVFFSSHQLSEVEAICNRIGVIRGGRLLYEGETNATAQESATIVRSPALERAVQVLNEAGHSCEMDAGLLIIRGADSAQINRTLVQAGIPVTEITQRERNLEQRFFDLLDDA